MLGRGLWRAFAEQKASTEEKESRSALEDKYKEMKKKNASKSNLSLKNAMVEALFKIKDAQELEVEAEPTARVDTFSKGTSTRKSVKTLLGVKQRMRKRRLINEQKPTDLLNKVQLSKLSTESMINSALFQHAFRLKKDLYVARKSNKETIEEFRRKEVRRPNNKGASEDKKYLAFKSFFKMLDDMIIDLKVNNPGYYKFLMKNKIFETLNPRNYTPDDLQMPSYPGTIKGPYPDDDPEFYSIWLAQNASPIMRDIQRVLSGQEDEEDSDEV